MTAHIPMLRTFVLAFLVLAGSFAVAFTSPAQEAGAEESSIADHVLLRYQELDAAWAEHFAYFGGTYVSPAVVVVVGPNDAASAGLLTPQIEIMVGPVNAGGRCGTVDATGGSFYCPGSMTIFLTYHDIVNQWSTYGDFSVSFLIAHEWGHHISALKYYPNFWSYYSQSSANSTFFELQADCYAGLYSHMVNFGGGLEYGDIEEAYYWAGSIGSDMYGNTDPSTWTHGSSRQRMEAFWTGYSTNSCDAYL